MTQPTVEQPNVEAAQTASRLVPISESIKYRRRAQQAEQHHQELNQQLEQLQTELSQAREQLGAAEAQRDEARTAGVVLENHLLVERMLAQAGVVDVDAAQTLLSSRLDLAQELDGADLTRQVEQLLLDKPFLRSASRSLAGPTASARSAGAAVGQLTQAAQRAIASGDRRDVAEYLRLRRQSDRRLSGN